MMGLTEQYFWESTPRKIIALIDQKKKIEKANIKNLACYVASYVWGKDPEENEEEEKPIIGVDIPASAGLVARMF